jgi:hypothetical protein
VPSKESMRRFEGESKYSSAVENVDIIDVCIYIFNDVVF